MNTASRSRSTTATFPARSLAALGLISLVAALGGCSAYDALAHGKATTTFADAGEFAKEHSDTASWLPADAKSITVVNSTRADGTMTIGYDSDTSPEGCEAVPRQSSPTMSIDTPVDVYSADSVQLCGDWAIAQDGEHWVAWTPAAEAE